MGVAYFPVLERELEGFDISIDGKMLARIMDDSFRAYTESLGVKPLIDFFGFDPAVLEDFDIEADASMTEKWFSAAEGLVTIEALIKALTETPYEYVDASGKTLLSARLAEETNAKVRDGAIEDLMALRGILAEADRRRVKWYLAIDF